MQNGHNVSVLLEACTISQSGWQLFDITSKTALHHNINSLENNDFCDIGGDVKFSTS